MVKSTGCFIRGPEFNSQQPHCGSQPSIMRSETLFWHAGTNADRELIHKIKKYINKRTNGFNRCKKYQSLNWEKNGYSVSDKEIPRTYKANIIMI